MKKNYLLTLIVVSLYSSILAQGQMPLTLGEKQIDFGLSLNRGGVPLFVGMDFAVHQDITVGGMASFNLNGFDYMNLGFRGDYHFNSLMEIPPEFDFYAGATLGFRLGFNDYDYDKYGKGLILGLQVGGRWYWNNQWGLMLEGGGGILGGSGRVGVSRKL